MEPLAALLKQMGSRWERLSLTQRVTMGTVLLAIAFSSFFLYQQAQDDYDILYANLSLPDAAAMTAKLKDAKAPFKLADGGTTIMVPRPRRNELVLETASELSSEQTINLAEIPPVLQGDVQKEWIKKLNTDAIAEVLRSIRGIKNARVIVTQPEHSVFLDKDEPPTASVMLMVEPGFRLKEDQIKVVKNLVAHAVPGLKAENVAIADNSGNPLEGPGIAGSGGTSDADVRRKSYEEEITKKVLSILSPVVGRDNAVVSVSAVMNFDQAQAKIHRVIPSGGDEASPTGLMVSQQEQLEEYTGGKKQDGGTAGAESNVPATGQQPAAGTNPQTTQTFQSTTGEKDKNLYTLSKKTTNYTNSEEDKNIIYASGGVERMTVAVVLNKVLTAKETEEIRELVSNAAGIDQARGDSVDIKGFQFTQVKAEKEQSLAEASKAAQDQAFYLQIASIGAVVLLGIASLFIFYNLFKRPAEGELMDEDEGNYFPRQEQLMSQLVDSDDEISAFLPSPVDREVEEKRENLNRIVEQDPTDAARVLLTYMKGM